MLYYFLPAIILLGIITSYGDIKYGKIRNKWILSALLYAIVAYSILISYYYSTNGISRHYCIELVTNMLFAVLVGFGLWYYGFWTAGDGKLFIAYSAIIPFSVYKFGYQEWTPSFTLLANMFVPIFLVILTTIIFKSKLKEIKEASLGFLKSFFQPGILLRTLIHVFAVLWIINIILSFLHLKGNFSFKILLSVAVLSLIQKPKNENVKKYILAALFSLGFLRLLVDKSVYSMDFLLLFLTLIFIWRFLMGLVRQGSSRLGQKILSKEIRIKELKPGMLLSEFIQKKRMIKKEELEMLKKRPDIQITKNKGFFYIKIPKIGPLSDNFIDEEAEGLTKEQIKKIKETGFKKIRVAQTMPFAPFMFLGVILTILAKGNIFIVLRLLF